MRQIETLSHRAVEYEFNEVFWLVYERSEEPIVADFWWGRLLLPRLSYKMLNCIGGVCVLENWMAGVYLTPDAHCLRFTSEQQRKHLKRKDVNSNL